MNKQAFHTLGCLLLIFFSQTSFALSPQKFLGSFNIAFQSNSSTIDIAGREELNKRLPKILNRSGLEIVIIVGYSDAQSEKANRPWQLGLATARARAIEQFFINAGLPRERICLEGRVVGETGSFEHTLPDDKNGIAEIVYVETCYIYSNCAPVDKLSD